MILHRYFYSKPMKQWNSFMVLIKNIFFISSFDNVDIVVRFSSLSVASFSTSAYILYVYNIYWIRICIKMYKRFMPNQPFQKLEWQFINEIKTNWDLQQLNCDLGMIWFCFPFFILLSCSCRCFCCCSSPYCVHR